MRASFISSLIDLAKNDERIFLLVGDVGYSLVEPFAQEFPSRFINIGIAEQNTIGVATGLALTGKIVFVYSLANFPTLRCLEQIRNDICYHDANVKIVSSGAGLAYGSLGATHHATEDVSIMRALPNMTVITPSDSVEASLATKAMAHWSSPCYLRLSKTGEPIINREIPDFQIGKAIRIRDGSDITLIGSGAILYNVIQAAQQLEENGIKARVLSMHTIKPLDNEEILTAARDTNAIITIEEHSIIGGLGSAVAEVLTEGKMNVSFMRMGIPDTFCKQVGNQDFLRAIYSISVDGITSSVMNLLGGGIR